MSVTVVLNVTPCSLVEIPDISDSLISEVYNECNCRPGCDAV
jgi:hypothetical protein